MRATKPRRTLHQGIGNDEQQDYDVMSKVAALEDLCREFSSRSVKFDVPRTITTGGGSGGGGQRGQVAPLNFGEI